MTRLLLLLSVVTLAQSKWDSIATPRAAFQYFRYGLGERVEKADFSSANPHPAFTYRFLHGPAPVRTVCRLEDRPGVYWYTPDGQKLNGTFATPNATEFSVSALENPMRGFSVTAAFAGSAAREGAQEVVYFADRPCADATLEYGFTRDLASDNILVYWATFANCANNAASLCRKTDNPSLGEGFSNVQQENSGTQVDHGFRIYGLDWPHPYTFQMTVEGRGFRVEVRDGAKLARCSDRPGTGREACSFLKTVEPWYPIGQTGRGYLTIGTQTAGDPAIAGGSRLQVADLRVAR